MPRLKKYLYAIFFVTLVVLVLSSVTTINVRREEFIEKLDKEVKEIKKTENEPLNEVSETQENTIAPEETPNEVIEPVNEVIEEVPISDSYTTRMTSFYADDGYGTGSCTGSGLCEWDFQVNEHGWYTYQGKLVVATATTYLANQGWYVASGVHLYKYWEELVLTIDGVEYDAIILDSCGSSMRTDRVDLFVSNAQSVKDTMIEVRRK